MLITALLLLLSHHHHQQHPKDPLECKWQVTQEPVCDIVPICDESGACVVLVSCHPPFACPE